jgi:hypothetical protein
MYQSIGWLEAAANGARTLNSILTATYWEIGRRIVEFEQGGKARAEYGEALLNRLSQDLGERHGRGFSHQGLQKMRAFYQGWEICPTARIWSFSRCEECCRVLSRSGNVLSAGLKSGPVRLYPARADTMPRLAGCNIQFIIGFWLSQHCVTHVSRT